MKTIFFALFLLFAFNTKLPSATAQFVTDTDGDFIINGGAYYIVPVIRGGGGGLGLAKLGNETCPLSVIQDPNASSNGLSIRISSPYRILYVYDGLPLTMAFDSEPSCAPTSNWRIVETPNGWSVTIAGYQDAVQGWFKIEQYYGDYKLVFCPTSRFACSNLGVYIDEDGNRRLAVNSRRPFVVMFKKVDSETSAI